MVIEEPLTFYTREDCHLCEQVLSMLQRVGLSWQSVDIDRDPELVEKYGIRVPVLSHPASGQELAYPFSEDKLRAFAAQ